MRRPTCRRRNTRELGARYRHHYIAHQNDLSLFDGVLPLLDELKARHHWLAVATGKSRRGLDDVLRHGRSSRACSTARAPPTRRPASRIR